MILKSKRKKLEAFEGETILTALNGTVLSAYLMSYERFCSFRPADFASSVVGSQKLVSSAHVLLLTNENINQFPKYRITQTIIELLLSNHPDDCLYCNKTIIANCKVLQRISRIERRFTERKTVLNSTIRKNYRSIRKNIFFAEDV